VQYGWSGCCDSAETESVVGGGEVGNAELDELPWQAREGYMKGQL
jgi:hypothetical protein